MKFIKLTLQDGREIYVNPDKISDFSKQIDNERTLISGCSEYGFYVKESPEKIIQKIQEHSIELQLIDSVEVSNGNFEKELSFLINRTCKDNSLNTHDFILAKFLCDCLEAFKDAKERSEYLKKDKESSAMDWKKYGD